MNLSSEERAKAVCPDHNDYLVSVGGHCPNCHKFELAIIDAEKAAADAAREPITDTSICKRGHPRACLVELKAEAPDGSMQGYAAECSACTQLEAELQALAGAVVEECTKRLRTACDAIPGNPSETFIRDSVLKSSADLIRALKPEAHKALERRLEAELKPFKEILTKFMTQHDEIAGKTKDDWMGMTICQCDLCKAAREYRGW